MGIAEFYGQADAVLSFEFFPPKRESDLDSVYAQMEKLSVLGPHFVTVTYGAGGGTRELTRRMLRYTTGELGLVAVSHLTCVNHSVEEIDAILDSIASEGIENVLALRGDPPRGSGAFMAHPRGFSCARDLVRHIAARGGFSIFVAGYPETHQEADSPDADMSYLREKVDAGAEAIFTQLFFDESFYFDFVERARGVGIRCPIVPGVMPIGSISQLGRFASMCGASIPRGLETSLMRYEDDPKGLADFGVEFAVSLCEKLLKGGAPGIHLFTLNNSFQPGAIVEALGLGRRRQSGARSDASKRAPGVVKSDWGLG